MDEVIQGHHHVMHEGLIPVVMIIILLLLSKGIILQGTELLLTFRLTMLYKCVTLLWYAVS